MCPVYTGGLPLRESHLPPYRLSPLPPEGVLFGGFEELLDLPLGGDTGCANAAEADGGHRIGETAGGDGGGGAVGGADKEGGGEDVAGAGEIDRRHLVPGQIGRLPAVDDADTATTEGDHAEAAGADSLDLFTYEGNLLVADDDRVDLPKQLARQAQPVERDLATGLLRPVAHPALWRDAKEPGGQSTSLAGINFLCDRTQVDHLRIPPVRRQSAQVDRAGPARHVLRAAASLILVEEHRRGFGVLDDDRELVRVPVERRYRNTAD